LADCDAIANAQKMLDERSDAGAKIYFQSAEES